MPVSLPQLGHVAMALALLTPAVGCKNRKFNTPSGVKGVYGTDDRKEIGEADVPWQALGKGVALVPSTGVMLQPNGDVVLRARPLKDVAGLCDDVRFANQPSLGKGTAFLLSETLALTASHVVSQCKGTMFLFDQTLEGLQPQSDGTYTVPKESVFQCAEILAQARKSDVDFSLIRLDRPATGRSFFRIASSEPPAKGDAVALFGHPSGLPLKFANNAQVISSNNAATFQSDLDAFKGNSGGPVVSERTGDLLGVLTSGNIDFIDQGRGCKDVALSNPSGVGETAMSVGLALPYFGDALAELGLAEAKDFDIDLSGFDFSAPKASLEKRIDVTDTNTLVGFDFLVDGTRESGLFCAFTTITPPGMPEARADWRTGEMRTLGVNGTPLSNTHYVLSAAFNFPPKLFSKAPTGTWKIKIARDCDNLKFDLRKLTLRLYLKK